VKALNSKGLNVLMLKGFKAWLLHGSAAHDYQGFAVSLKALQDKASRVWVLPGSKF
jgi:hypothetical protein